MNQNLTEQIKHLILGLYEQGVRHVVVSPGSRTTPIALLLAEFSQHIVDDFQLHVALDERDAGFLGLGIAKTSQEPVALLATSGTATANYAPAIAEAAVSHVPLLALTTDRPEELQHIGAPQTIAQTGLYGGNVKNAVTLTLQSESPDALAYLDYEVQHLVHQSVTAPAGPVQLNLPLRKPLMPDLEMPWPTIKPQAFPDLTAQVELNPALVELLQREIVFLAGPVERGDYTQLLVDVAKKHQIPVIADVLSQVRPAPGQIIGIDSLVAANQLASLPVPQVIVRFGATPVSAKLLQWIQSEHIPVLQVGKQYVGHDHSRQSEMSLDVNETSFLKAFDQQIGQNTSTFYQAWLATQTRLTEIGQQMVQTPLDDLGVVQTMNNLPMGTRLFIANSMPIRDYDNYWQPKHAIKTWANRGANGIDGTVATAAGMALAGGNNWLAIGDLALFHDLNGIALAKQLGVDLTILVTNNAGGGIFSFLPQASADEYFEQLFGTPQGWSIEKVADLFDAQYQRIQQPQALQQAVDQPADGLKIIEVTTQRQQNVVTHQTVLNQLGADYANN
ncbi:2-succinyl-5-enolpyruvyl-6-hydroxy-3-cyclohexene-1-carboxylate synthase [Weissella uvarum]|uniref:2-succinyl-5-enolpyruvyl-6-hydroxy-3- cyclohexene-1-carboxylic-acid synthase n=1 Tax=Weissella uvarum TaxID=1479233 RepID=UPI0019602D92|nr:2-succinyl-5-enolpyruvyl-6-hydroxy-3-cyclohexene-1-carboxylic-acid synthase [Weissella uvarum]MBM7616532.1 2-succinyl-5-enolpyruvyl-6-hydroxy-3-cyclohexene-1-carboxylate synthase [Weissella uvarum]